MIVEGIFFEILDAVVHFLEVNFNFLDHGNNVIDFIEDLCDVCIGGMCCGVEEELLEVFEWLGVLKL